MPSHIEGEHRLGIEVSDVCHKEVVASKCCGLIVQCTAETWLYLPIYFFFPCFIQNFKKLTII